MRGQPRLRSLSRNRLNIDEKVDIFRDIKGKVYGEAPFQQFQTNARPVFSDCLNYRYTKLRFRNVKLHFTNVKLRLEDEKL